MSDRREPPTQYFLFFFFKCNPTKDILMAKNINVTYCIKLIPKCTSDNEYPRPFIEEVFLSWAAVSRRLLSHCCLDSAQHFKDGDRFTS